MLIHHVRVIHVASIVSLSLALTTPTSGQTTRPTDTTSTQPAAPTTRPGQTPHNIWANPTLTGDWSGARTELERLGIGVRLFYNQQYQQNFRGGLRNHHGERLSGSYDLHAEADFGKMGFVEGLSFFIETKGGWSDGINPDKVGALYSVNADACDDHPIYVKKWWFKQMLWEGKLEFRLGVLETNKDLVDVSPYANHEDKDFLNVLSIRDVTIPHRTGMGAFTKLKTVDWLYVQAALVDAQSRPRRTGFDTAFHQDAWFTGYWELGLTPVWKTGLGKMLGRYRVGGWYDPTVKTPFAERVRKKPDRRGGDSGLYVGLDQMVFREQSDPRDSQGLGLFSRLGMAHGDINRTSLYWSAGMSYQGLLPTRDRDVIGFAVAQAALSSQYHDHVNAKADRETVYEWYYSYYLSPWCIISPDFQVVTNPGGDTDDHDAIVGGIRIRLIF